MMIRHFRKIAILMSILMIVLVACGPQETETPEPTDVPATEAVVEETEEAVVEETEEVVVEETEEAVVEETEEAVVEETEEAVVEETEEAVVEETEEVVVEETEEAVVEETEEAVVEEAEEAADMSDVSVASYDNGAGFTFDYPEGYDVRAGANSVSLAMGEQRLVVISPAGWNSVVIGDRTDVALEQQLTSFVRRLGYTSGDTADMMMTDASINIESVSRGLVGFANLIDLGDDNIVVVLELGPDSDNVPSADGAIISNTVAYGMDMSDDDMSDDSEDMEATEEAPDMSDDSEDMVEETPTIVGLALDTENLSVLVQAVVSADFFETLNGEGSFTVFAPTDDAFATALEALGLSAEELFADSELLSAVLTYHVLDGTVLSSDLEDGQEVETLNGAILTVGVSDEGITLTDATGATHNVIAADVMASNGIVHVIDGVLLPSAGE